MKRKTELLERVFVALEDAMLLYAPEFTSEEQKRDVSKRLHEKGGTLAYFADLREELRNRFEDEEYDNSELKTAFAEDFTANYLAHMRDEFDCEGREIEEILFMAFCRGHKHYVSDDS